MIESTDFWRKEVPRSLDLLHCEEAAAEFVQLPAEEAVKWLVEWCEAAVNS